MQNIHTLTHHFFFTNTNSYLTISYNIMTLGHDIIVQLQNDDEDSVLVPQQLNSISKRQIITLYEAKGSSNDASDKLFDVEILLLKQKKRKQRHKKLKPIQQRRQNLLVQTYKLIPKQGKF